MSKPFISLCPEITRANALNLVDWLSDEDVVRHLSDSRHVSRHIEQLIDRVQLPILTHLFNQGGRFFMAYDRDDLPVGFVRLVRNGPDCEIVLVIGKRDNWGRKLGASALHEGMKLAFFDMRAERLIARIHADNTRSLKAFAHNGFVLENETPALKSYAMTAQRYLQRLRAGLPGAAAASASPPWIRHASETGSRWNGSRKRPTWSMKSSAPPSSMRGRCSAMWSR
jgi:regulator of nucleoside diphosphate kinase